MNFKNMIRFYFTLLTVLALCWGPTLFAAEAAHQIEHSGVVSVLEDFNGVSKNVFLPFPYSSITPQERATCAFVPQYFYTLLQDTVVEDPVLEDECLPTCAVLGPLRPCLGVIVHNCSPEGKHKALVFHIAVDVQGVQPIIDVIHDIFPDDEITQMTLTVFTNLLRADDQAHDAALAQKQDLFLKEFLGMLKEKLNCVYTLNVSLWNRPYQLAGPDRCNKFFGAQDSLFVKANGQIFSTSLFHERVFREGPLLESNMRIEEIDLALGNSYKKILFYYMRDLFTEDELISAVEVQDLVCQELTDCGLDFLYQILQEEID